MSFFRAVFVIYTKLKNDDKIRPQCSFYTAAGITDVALNMISTVKHNTHIRNTLRITIKTIMMNELRIDVFLII